jgi:hypothetical protein
MAGPVDLVLLRGLIADLPLNTGAMVSAKVLERQGTRGLLAMEGARVWATLPDDVPAGARLRMRVSEASADRVVFQVVPAAEHEAAHAPAAVTPAPVWTGSVALPGGAQARLTVERDGAQAGRRGVAAATSVLLRYDSPQLGRMDMLVSAEGVSVHAAAGEPASRARDGAGVLRDALRGATGRAATVTVHDRTDTVDLRA